MQHRRCAAEFPGASIWDWRDRKTIVGHATSRTAEPGAAIPVDLVPATRRRGQGSVPAAGPRQNRTPKTTGTKFVFRTSVNTEWNRSSANGTIPLIGKSSPNPAFSPAFVCASVLVNLVL